jgi:hypothetical protein
MAHAHSPEPVKLIVGMLAGRDRWLEAARAELAGILGPTDLTSPIMPFDYTDYYRDEMGPALLRQFVAIAEPADPARLADLKGATNAAEADLSARLAAEAGLPRPVNLDVGYVTESKLILASCKNFAHRVYLRDGVYAEVTLRYVHGRWTPFDWTFPDYAGEAYHPFLTAARERLRAQLGRKGAA